MEKETSGPKCQETGTKESCIWGSSATIKFSIQLVTSKPGSAADRMQKGLRNQKLLANSQFMKRCVSDSSFFQHQEQRVMQLTVLFCRFNLVGNDLLRILRTQLIALG
ncbi:hypothetical protein PIB30_040091 [Stylosanthes scabra]|uniref:Uncharacterized protein n=1 Tax=Stylosanthes scabra TaxID=79078 RepID=A0ABU6ZD64_9FABA|nr:hypothetical protein [Stylosanthes scabra]